MATIAEIRQKFPQYQDMPDAALADAIHKKYYGDMPKADFDTKIGISAAPTPSAPEPTPAEAPDPWNRMTFAPIAKNMQTGEIAPALPKVITEAPGVASAIYEGGKNIALHPLDTATNIAKGVYEGGKAALTAPNRAYTGELQMTGPDGKISPEAIAEGFNFATWATPAAPGTLLPKAAAPVVAPVAKKALTEGQQVALAGERLGVKVPRAAASDLTAVQQMGKVTTNVPIGGTPLRKASEQAIGQLDDAAMRTQKGFGSGDVAAAGAAARQGIQDYSANTLDDLVSKKYDVVDDLVDNNIRAPLSGTAERAAKITADRANAKLSGSSAVSQVSGALAKPPEPKTPVGFVHFGSPEVAPPPGLNYQGVKKLRTSIGEMIKDPRLAPAGTSQDELRAIYGGLSDDLRGIVSKSGDKASKAFEEANTLAAKTVEEQKALDSIIGPKSDEGLFSKIQSMAGSTARADMQNLVRVRKAVSPETWNEISSAVISTMGRDPTGKFSPDRFLTSYGKLSQNGKGLLFKSTGKDDLASSLDDIATVSNRFKQLNQFANPSGTGQAIIGGSYIPGMFVEPTSVISGIVGTRVLSSVLAKPTSAKKLAEWAKAYETVATKPSKTANNMLNVRAKVLALAIANDAGVPQQVGNIIGSLSGVRYAKADPGNEDLGAEEHQQERERKQLRAIDLMNPDET